MNDDMGKKIIEAKPSVPVEIIGITGTPVAGDDFDKLLKMKQKQKR